MESILNNYYDEDDKVQEYDPKSTVTLLEYVATVHCFIETESRIALEKLDRPLVFNHCFPGFNGLSLSALSSLLKQNITTYFL